MKIQIKSRKALEKISASPFEEDVAIISITDVDDLPVNLKHLPKGILSISFNDVDNDVMIDELGITPTDDERIFIENKYHMLTDEQANQIATFYFLSMTRLIALFVNANTANPVVQRLRLLFWNIVAEKVSQYLRTIGIILTKLFLEKY